MPRSVSPSVTPPAGKPPDPAHKRTLWVKKTDTIDSKLSNRSSKSQSKNRKNAVKGATSSVCAKSTATQRKTTTKTSPDTDSLTGADHPTPPTPNLFKAKSTSSPAYDSTIIDWQGNIHQINEFSPLNNPRTPSQLVTEIGQWIKDKHRRHYTLLTLCVLRSTTTISTPLRLKTALYYSSGYSNSILNKIIVNLRIPEG
jgi:hypothetical protein